VESAHKELKATLNETVEAVTARKTAKDEILVESSARAKSAEPLVISIITEENESQQSMGMVVAQTQYGTQNEALPQRKKRTSLLF